MATDISQPSGGRTAVRRAATVEEVLDHAERIVEESGAGAVTVAEIARRMGIKPPSVYKYFPSLHAIYDGLFARGNARLAQYVDEAVDELEPGLERLLEGNRAFLRWSMLNLGLAPLLFWRPIPGFEPSPESYALAVELVARARADLSEAVRKGDLDESADSEEAFRLLTTLGAGIASQQLANEPGATYETGVFTSLTDRALDMFVQQHAPRRSRGTSPTSPRRNR
jgi:AcrR family transcriptional regulator